MKNPGSVLSHKHGTYDAGLLRACISHYEVEDEDPTVRSDAPVAADVAIKLAAFFRDAATNTGERIRLFVGHTKETGIDELSAAGLSAMDGQDVLAGLEEKWTP